MPKKRKRTTATRTTKTPSSAGSILALAAQQQRRQPIDHIRYRPMLQELEAFVRGRADGDHDCGLNWFVQTGMPALNAHRQAQGLEPMPCLRSPGPLRAYALKQWPELAKHFCR